MSESLVERLRASSDRTLAIAIAWGLTNAELLSSLDREAADELDRLQAIIATLPKLADELVQAVNQLHGIRHTKMAKGTIVYVEKELREAAEAARKESNG